MRTALILPAHSLVIVTAGTYDSPKSVLDVWCKDVTIYLKLRKSGPIPAVPNRCAL
jgi:hypothetical protein